MFTYGALFLIALKKLNCIKLYLSIEAEIIRILTGCTIALIACYVKTMIILTCSK